ncbi:MAG: translation initiation factor IF-2 [Euryhalocaulis sp.]|uniref:translation initiation factor IF-2 n=1 Tax=Euryhalocaulis sp. TaxID=2744307 RepID=UPI0017A64403|nr:translation initiation factor IF-2 [Euryhalocaulis sp.]MBA4801190.1 translation initiation factor IF-2 [Euryhalocaulis sp.]
MSDAKDTDKPGGRKPLTLKRTTGAGTVNQSFARGKTKSVVVEKKRKRVLGPQSGGAPTRTREEAKKAPPRSDRGLSEEEMQSRQRAIEKARAEEEERRERQRAEEEERERRAAEDRQRLEEARKREEEEARQREAEQARAKAESEAAEAESRVEESREKPADKKSAQKEAPEEEGLAGAVERAGGRVKSKKSGGPAAPKASPKKRAESPKRRGKLTIQNVFEDDEDRQRSLASVRRAREREKERREQGGAGSDKQARDVVVPETITVQELANRMAERTADVVKYLMKEGQMLRANEVIDADMAELIVEDFGHRIKRVAESDVETGFIEDDDPEEKKKPRPPIVTVMGHVDHGKTSLLDAMRSTDVVAGEAGGITQHIGAYQVQIASGDKITFLDTPGHAAFSAMRARGANVTDIVILVVAADDGVMPQTVEAINHAKAAETPIIVAVNKIDKQGADPQKVLQDLLQHEIVVESMGGDTQVVEVSALQKKGLDELTEAIALQAEVLELTANPDRLADGIVIESKLEQGRGAVATLLVNRGSLKRGDIVVAGTQWGKVRALMNERGQQVKQAGPALPVEIMGLDGAPEPGEPFAVVETEARARDLTEYRVRMVRDSQTGGGPSAAASLEQMMTRVKDKEISEFPLLIKADVQGSAEAIAGSLNKIGNDEVRARIIHQGVGGISESDVSLAKSSGSPILAFNVRANKQARELAEREGVEIRYYSIIYDLLDDIKAVLEGMLAPEKREEFLGYAEVLEVFNISKLGKVAGCRITDGIVRRGSGVRLLRDDTVIHEGKLSTLKRFKDEVTEVKSGQECGMGFENYHDIQKGDQIECFEVTMHERTL